jgi:hypothetical protein
MICIENPAASACPGFVQWDGGLPGVPRRLQHCNYRRHSEDMLRVVRVIGAELYFTNEK